MARDPAALVAALDRGDRRSVARLLTCVEDAGPETLRGLVAALYPRSGDARVIGVTGAPGVGKSSLTNALAGALRASGRSVGVIAVDPSSPFTGGALLGDRVRMQSHHADPGVFIRSMAARGHLGGLAFATPHAVLVLDAAGFDDVVIETVGVGQAEVDVAATADTTVVVLAPGMGDAVQAAKAGILEVADVFAVNKADRDGAAQVEADIRGMLELGREVDGSDGRRWSPPIVRTVAVQAEGAEDLLRAIDAHWQHLVASGRLAERRRTRAAQTVREIALQRLRGRLGDVESGGAPLLRALATRVADRELDPYSAADLLLDAL